MGEGGAYVQAHPIQVFEKYNLLRFCVSEEVRAMWAALTEDVEGAPEDDYPEDIDIDSTDIEQLAKKRDWHVAWLQAVIEIVLQHEPTGLGRTRSTMPFGSMWRGLAAKTSRHGTRLRSGRCRVRGRRRLWHRKRGATLTRRRSSRR
jgi:hypothetical protein